MSEKPSLFLRVGPLIAALLVIIADQVSKAFIVQLIPLNAIAWSWGDDFFWLMHVRNTGVAFSLGNGLPDIVRTVVFVALPSAVLIGLGIFAWRDRTLTVLQRWSLGLILGGGLGNIIDRIFRPDGVVDFLSFRLYGFLGMERFATFNLADSAVSVGGALLVLSLILGRKKK